MFNEQDFEKCLAFSRGRCSGTHEDRIRQFLGDSCVKVEQVEGELNLRGVDYRATLRRGATIDFDTKERTSGCSSYWKRMPLLGLPDPEPELSLEKWSVCPTNGHAGKVGWTLDESKVTDYTLHSFDSLDTIQYFILPFQLLRMVFRKNILDWYKRFGGPRRQYTNRNGLKWSSEIIFVPACIVLEAIQEQMRQSS